MTEITFDKEYWPKTGTVISTSLPTDLNDLWEKFEEQASTFVAEALINEVPTSHVDLSTATVETFLWTIGGDVVCLSEKLAPLIEGAASDYHTGVHSAEQAGDLLERLAGLAAIQAAIDKAGEIITAQLKAYTASASLTK
jgi:hypothetical protein